MDYRSTIPDLQKKIAVLPDPEPVNPDFLYHVRTRRKFVLNEANLHRSCTLVNLGKIAMRLLRPLHYDPVKQEFINDDQANLMVLEPMRAPWVI
jgi:myo-inositol 2-dehydrogenase / D-chiro-inositol 1-dehydrogenase